MKKSRMRIPFSIILFIILFVLFYLCRPRFISYRWNINEKIVKHNRLELIYIDQVYFRNNKKKDADNNQIDEYATSEDFRKVISQGFSAPFYKRFVDGKPDILGEWTGYYFIIYVSGETSIAEQHWCCYSFPVEYPTSGRYAFFINETGKIWQTKERGIYNMNLHDIPKVGDAYTAQAFISGIDQTKWKLIKDISENNPK